MKNLIGRKVKGFKFEGPRYSPKMDNYIGKVGVITVAWGGEGVYRVDFEDGDFWNYPAEEIEQHIVKENLVTRQQLDEVYGGVCDEWKEKIRSIISPHPFSDEFGVSDDLIKQARYSAETKRQKEWLDKVFGEDEDGLRIGVRPKSLQGIEDNNGWIRIESEEDLPKESGLYFILDEDDNIIHSEFDINFGQFFAKDFAYDHYELTYYQPIVKPEPPIY